MNLILLTIFHVWFSDILSQRVLENVQNNSAHKEFVYFKNVWKFWTQKVLIPHILVTSPSQNVSILFVNNIYIGNISTFWHRKLYLKTCYSSKCLSIIAIFLYYFLIPKCVNTPKPKNVPDRRMCQYRPSCILLTSISEIDSNVILQCIHLDINC